MDFSFRTFYHRKTSGSTASQSSTYTYFSQRANQCDMESYNGGRHDQILGMRERELEKESIRREILEEEAVRRRELEEEVRREIRIEREMELRERERVLELREIRIEREMELRERERVLELRERELELRERGSDHWEPLTSGRYVERVLFERRVTLPVEERMYDFPRLEWEKKVGGNEEELPVQERMYYFPRLEWEKKVGGNEEELHFQSASQLIRTEVQSSSDVFKEEPTKTVLRTSSDVFKMKEPPFQRASQPYKTEVKTLLKVKELPIQQASQTNKTEVKTSSDAVKVKELPFQRASRPYKTEVKTSSDVVKMEEKKQSILLAKPDANHSRNKRKDMASLVEGPSKVTKKLANEWSCALCQISATSELGLQDHLKGKKHKSKQTGLRTGMIGLCSKKIIDPLDISQVGERNVELEESQQTSNEPLNISQVGEKNVELEESQQTSKDHETGVENNNDAIVKEEGCGGAVQKMHKNKITNFKFYCKMCEVGTFSQKVMNCHKKGKKHLLRLHQLDAEI